MIELANTQLVTLEANSSTLPVGLAEVMGRASGENFPVALSFLPARTRRQLLSIYGFARFVDEIGDSYQGDRLELLDWAEQELLRAAGDSATHPVFAHLASTIQDLELPLCWFCDLIEANRTDQVVTRYHSFEDLERYCSLSANPIGRLVLSVFGEANAKNAELSDHICTALQVIEHLQDLKEDFATGRIYLPTEDLVSFKVEESMLEGSRATPELRRLIAFEAARARGHLEAGSGLLPRLCGWARICIAGYFGGGTAQLDALEGARFDPLAGAVKASKSSVLTHLVRALAIKR